MARHRNVRNMRYEDELSLEEYGRSYDDMDSYAISPATEAQFTFNRSRSKEHTLSSFMEESDKDEDDDESNDDDDHLHDSTSNFKMPELDEVTAAKLQSGLEHLEGILGDNCHQPTAVDALMRFNYDVERALNDILSRGGRQTLTLPSGSSSGARIKDSTKTIVTDDTCQSSLSDNALSAKRKPDTCNELGIPLKHLKLSENDENSGSNEGRGGIAENMRQTAEELAGQSSRGNELYTDAKNENRSNTATQIAVFRVKAMSATLDKDQNVLSLKELTETARPHESFLTDKKYGAKNIDENVEKVASGSEKPLLAQGLRTKLGVNKPLASSMSSSPSRDNNQILKSHWTGKSLLEIGSSNRISTDRRAETASTTSASSSLAIKSNCLVFGGTSSGLQSLMTSSLSSLGTSPKQTSSGKLAGIGSKRNIELNTEKPSLEQLGSAMKMPLVSLSELSTKCAGTSVTQDSSVSQTGIAFKGDMHSDLVKPSLVEVGPVMNMPLASLSSIGTTSVGTSPKKSSTVRQTSSNAKIGVDIEKPSLEQLSDVMNVPLGSLSSLRTKALGSSPKQTIFERSGRVNMELGEGKPSLKELSNTVNKPLGSLSSLGTTPYNQGSTNIPTSSNAKSLTEANSQKTSLGLLGDTNLKPLGLLSSLDPVSKPSFGLESALLPKHTKSGLSLSPNSKGQSSTKFSKDSAVMKQGKTSSLSELAMKNEFKEAGVLREVVVDTKREEVSELIRPVMATSEIKEDHMDIEEVDLKVQQMDDRENREAVPSSNAAFRHKSLLQNESLSGPNKLKAPSVLPPPPGFTKPVFKDLHPLEAAVNFSAVAEGSGTSNELQKMLDSLSFQNGLSKKSKIQQDNVLFSSSKQHSDHSKTKGNFESSKAQSSVHSCLMNRETSKRRPSSFGAALSCKYVTKSSINRTNNIETKRVSEFTLPVQIDLRGMFAKQGNEFIPVFNFSTPSPDDIVRARQQGAFARRKKASSSSD